jgi:hypothetical protein
MLLVISIATNFQIMVLKFVRFFASPNLGLISLVFVLYANVNFSYYIFMEYTFVTLLFVCLSILTSISYIKTMTTHPGGVTINGFFDPVCKTVLIIN